MRWLPFLIGALATSYAFGFNGGKAQVVEERQTALEGCEATCHEAFENSESFEMMVERCPIEVNGCFQKIMEGL